MTETTQSRASSRRRQDRRPVAIVVTLLAILVLGVAIARMPQSWWLSEPPDAAVAVEERPPVDVREVDPAFRRPAVAVDSERWRRSAADAPDPLRQPDAHAQEQLESQLRVLFEHGVSLLAQGDYERADQTLAMVLNVLPDFPEAHVNRGFALYELKRYGRAKTHFRTAIELNPGQANAYYGLAMVYEAEGDLERALGGMRSFIHLAKGYDEHHLTKARAAIWEWDEQLAKIRGQATGDNSQAPGREAGEQGQGGPSPHLTNGE